MNSNTVLSIRNNDICCSCGICKNVCPVNAIEYVRENGIYVPQISENCVNCGKCFSVCPSVCHSYETDDIYNAVKGNVLKSVNAWSKNEEIRHYSASSGVVTTLVKCLLEKGMYDCVFTLDTYDYTNQLKTRKYGKYTFLLENIEKQKFTKSRYLPVSHEELVKYILSDKESRVIVIGTSCALRGIIKVIDKFKLNRDNYLLIGLFCELVMNYNLYDYFSDEIFTEGKKLSSLHFKNKDSGGWPGNMKLIFSDETSKFLDKKKRMEAKNFFQMERCLYCIDKMNVSADISLGDNYTDQNSTLLGSNSVIIRTEKGMQCFNVFSEYIQYEDVDYLKIQQAQYIDAKKNNLAFSKIKKEKIKDKTIVLNSNSDSLKNYKDYMDIYLQQLRKIIIGKQYPKTKEILLKEIELLYKVKKTSLLRHLKNYIRRRINFK